MYHKKRYTNRNLQISFLQKHQILIYLCLIKSTDVFNVCDLFVLPYNRSIQRTGEGNFPLTRLAKKVSLDWKAEDILSQERCMDCADIRPSATVFGIERPT